MREIKFRVWDTKRKCWFQQYNAEGLWVNICPDGEVIWGEQDGAPDLNEGRFEIQMFTGLKDKNGKEIYEGDIVRAIHHDRPWSKSRRGKKFCWPIVFENGSFIQKWDWSYGDFNHGQHTKDTEIVGNIYENMELLKGDK